MTAVFFSAAGFVLCRQTIRKEDPEDCVTDVLIKVLAGCDPYRRGGQDQAHALENCFLSRPGEHIAAAFESFRPFSRIPQGNVGDMEQAAFLLDRPAVAQDAAGVLFKPDKIKEPERLIKMDNLRIGRYIELPDLIARSGMETADDRHAVLPAKCSEGCKVTPEPVGQIDILRAVESHQEKPVLFYFEAAEYIRAADRVGIVVDHFENGIARDKNSFSADTLPDEICPAPFCIGHQDITRMIDNSAVYFFRNPIVITTVSRLHVKYRDTSAFCDDG